MSSAVNSATGIAPPPVLRAPSVEPVVDLSVCMPNTYDQISARLEERKQQPNGVVNKALLASFISSLLCSKCVMGNLVYLCM